MKREPRLAPNSVGTGMAVAQSLASTAPAAAAAGSLLGTAGVAGAAFPLAVLIAMLASLFWINTPYQFSKRIAGAGGDYHFSSVGVSPMYGALAVWFVMLSFLAFDSVEGLYVFGVLLPNVFNVFGFASYPELLWIPLTIVFSLGIFYFAYRGIKPSLQYSLVASMYEIAILILISLVIIISIPSSNTLQVFLPSASPSGLNGVLLGVVFGLGAGTGLGRAVNLGEEAKTAKRTIPKALLLSWGMISLTWVLFAYANTIGWGLSSMSSYASAGVPGMILAKRFLGTGGYLLIVIALLNSDFAGKLASNNATGRQLFALARDRLLPDSLVRVHPKYRTPSIGLFVAAAATIVFAVSCGLVFGPLGGFIFILLIGGVASLAGHIMGSSALISLYRKMRGLNPILCILAPIVFIGTALAAGYGLFIPFNYPVYLAPIIIIIWAVVGYAIFAYAKARRVADWSKVGSPPEFSQIEVPGEGL